MEDQIKLLSGIKSHLRNAVINCSERGLYHSAKWAVEALNGIGNEHILIERPVDIFSETSQPSLNNLEYDKFLLAKAYFDLREFDRAAHVLRDSQSPRCLFLRLYSKYLAGEKRKEEESQDIMGTLDNRLAINQELAHIQSELSQAAENTELDGFCLYLYGIVLSKRNIKQMALEMLVKSINKYPYNWSAWLELASCITTPEMVTSIMTSLPDNFMTKFFLAHVTLEMHQNTESFHQQIRDLTILFPHSTYLQSQKALACYNAREFEEAEILFDELKQQDPHRLEHMDIYSNVLYVMDKKAKLSMLAHQAAITDRFRPETCCITGNYYSLKSEHEKAVLYFRRALKLNRNYLSAWTLMGHEYVEMKNTNAATEAYRRAVDINHRDYRAWYGLGQAYELLKLPMYALYYYQRATAIRPYDARMWCVLADCYEKLEHDSEAIKCYKRALICSDNNELSALAKMALLYKRLGKSDMAALYYSQLLEKSENNQTQDVGEATLFLAYYEKSRGNLRDAEAHCNTAMQYTGQIKDEAKALLRDIRSLLNIKNSFISSDGGD